jgi:hypothetical protein
MEHPKIYFELCTQQNSLPTGAKGYFKESVPDLDHPNVLGRYERYAGDFGD